MKKFTIIMVLCLPLLICACRAPVRGQMGVLDTNAVMFAVLADMVTNASDSKDLIRFVDLHPPEVELLRKRCEGRYQIFPFEMAEFVEKKTLFTEWEGIPETSIRLKSTHQEGVLLDVEVTRIQGGRAEAEGSYSGSAGFRYRLRYTRGWWKILSCENFWAV